MKKKDNKIQNTSHNFSNHEPQTTVFPLESYLKYPPHIYK